MVVAEMLCACRCGEAWQHETRWGRIGRYFWGAVADITAEAMQTEDDDEDADRSEEYSDDGRVSD